MGEEKVVVETVLAGNYVEMETDSGKPKNLKASISQLFWHGGSAYDAWFSCSSNQVIFFIFIVTFVSFVMCHA